MRSESVLLPVYFFMVAVAVCLNVFSGSGYDPVNIVVNICMFLIIGCIILWANTRCFMPVSRMVARMRYTIQTIEIDFNKTESYLWRTYQDRTTLFDNKLLDARFHEYQLESMRLDILSGRGFRCDIEDYINEYFIDATMKKGMVSIIPGIMTGLGILGTFIGLSFGLQNFNTGNAEAITNSIAPLMDGIKIAFHTSIYGMVFSLIFNFVYKKTLEDAYRTVDKFLETYHKYVLPRADSQNIQVLINAIDEMGDKIADRITEARGGESRYQPMDRAANFQAAGASDSQAAGANNFQTREPNDFKTAKSSDFQTAGASDFQAAESNYQTREPNDFQTSEQAVTWLEK